MYYPFKAEVGDEFNGPVMSVELIAVYHWYGDEVEITSIKPGSDHPTFLEVEIAHRYNRYVDCDQIATQIYRNAEREAEIELDDYAEAS